MDMERWLASSRLTQKPIFFELIICVDGQILWLHESGKRTILGIQECDAKFKNEFFVSQSIFDFGTEIFDGLWNLNICMHANVNKS